MPYTPPDPAVLEANLKTFEQYAPNGEDAPEPETVLDGTEPVGAFGEALTAPHLVLELEGDRQLFRAHRKANQFLLVRHIDALAGDGFPYVRAVTVLALGQVLKDERERLEAYLAEHGADEDYPTALDAALSACWRGETMLPFQPSSD